MVEGDLFERARAVSIADVAGVTLFRAGRRLRGPCPLCGASAGKKADGAFWVDDEAGKFGCFACDAHGDVIEFARATRGGSPREAAEWLAGATFTPVARAMPAQRSAQTMTASDLALRLWGETAADVSPVRRYLAGRGISIFPRGMRFNPMAWWGREAEVANFMPAMVAQVVTAKGPTGGVHLTYLVAPGYHKTRRDPGKRMFGPQNDETASPGGVLLSPMTGDAPLIVGEGIESALSAAQLYGQPCRVAATLSLQRLQGGWVLDKYGRLDPDSIAGDPARPPFVWPGVKHVILAVDRDMGPVTVKCRRPTGGTCQRVLSADERARICGTLAAQAWRRAGTEHVEVIAPGAGQDFNDMLLARRS